VGKKSIRNSFDSACTYDKVHAAYERARKGKTLRPEVRRFEQRLEANLIQILDDLRNETYAPSKYRTFTIFEPKERLILALPFRDRVVHQWYVEEFIKPFFVPRFISGSYACIIGRGTHKAVDKVHYYMRRVRKLYGDFYIVKMDISKFFYNIDRDVLFEILRRKVADTKLLQLTKTILYHAPESGIPIGNYTSQYFANIYLNELDQFMKRNLRMRYYVRYMDDFICMVRDKAEARIVFTAVGNFLADNLNLRLNSKSRYYPSRFGLDFCGYRLFFDYKLIRTRAKKSLNIIIRDYERDGDEALFMRRLISWQGSARKADTYTFRLTTLMNYLPVIERYYAARRTPKPRTEPELWLPRC
jgi:retron-type reverse transcriptase